jgi:hypothetical protein
MRLADLDHVAPAEPGAGRPPLGTVFEAGRTVGRAAPRFVGRLLRLLGPFDRTIRAAPGQESPVSRPAALGYAGRIVGSQPEDPSAASAMGSMRRRRSSLRNRPRNTRSPRGLEGSAAPLNWPYMVEPLNSVSSGPRCDCGLQPAPASGPAPGPLRSPAGRRVSPPRCVSAGPIDGSSPRVNSLCPITRWLAAGRGGFLGLDVSP